MNARIFAACLLAFTVVLSAAYFPAHAADSRKRDGAFASQRAMGEVDRTSGWCDTASTSPTNVWASANLPVEIASSAAGLENRRAIRFLTIRHVDALNAVPMCARLGPNTGSTPTRNALTCVGTAGSEATNGTFFRVAGEGRSYLIGEIATTATPELWVRSSTGDVRYCVEVTWKS